MSIRTVEASGSTPPDVMADRDADGVPDAASDPALLAPTAFAYNAADQTVAASTPRGAAAFAYRGTGQAERVASADPSGALTTFTHTLLGLSSRRRGAAAAYFLRDPSGGLLGWHTPAGTFSYLTDTLGSVVGLVNASGRLVARYDYDPFGGPTELWTPRQASTDAFVPFGAPPETVWEGDDAVARANPYRFASAYLDPTGLYHMGERYYDPALGRFTQPDPIYDALDPKLWNPYVYVGNDPVNFVDPTGRGWWDKAKCIGANIASGVASAFSGTRGDLTTATGPLWIGGGLLFAAGVSAVYLGAAVAAGGAVLLGSAAILVGAVMVLAAAYRDVTSCWD